MKKPNYSHVARFALGIALTTFIFSCGAGGLPPQDDLSYFGEVAHEAEYSLDAHLIMTSATQQRPTSAVATREVRNAAKYAMGHMRSDGSISYGFKTTIKSIDAVSAKTFKITYNISGKAVLKKLYSKYYNFIVPVYPQSMHALAEGKCFAKDYAADKSTFWYHWDTQKEGCPLVEGEHYLKVKTDLKVLDQKETTYPEYERLMVNNTLTMTMLFGADAYGNKNWNPNDQENTDWGARGYRQARSYLKQLGYADRRYEEAELRQIYNPKNAAKLPFAEEMTKELNGKKVQIRLVFLDTHVSATEASEAFHYFFRRALRTDSVVLYNGHSGMGSNLDLDRLEAQRGFKIPFNPNYQIVFMGSCIPYAYYSDMYFKRKITAQDPKGTKNLDILAYAKESYFGTKENEYLVRALDLYAFTGHKMSYQELITATPVDLYGVLGDEDNN